MTPFEQEQADREELAANKLAELLERRYGAYAAQDWRRFLDTAIAFPTRVIEAVFARFEEQPRLMPMPPVKAIEAAFEAMAMEMGIESWRTECDRVCRPHFPRQKWQYTGDCCESALMHNIRLQRWAADPDWKQSDAEYDAMMTRLRDNLPSSVR